MDFLMRARTAQQQSREEQFFHSLVRLASVWNAKLTLHSHCSSPLFSLYRDLGALRAISILHVAHVLGMDIVKTGADTYAMKEELEITSLVLFKKSNTWKRFSGKEQGGVSGGSTIDLVMHIHDCPYREAIDFLSSRFL